MLTRTAMNKLRNIGFNQADFLAISNILSGASDDPEEKDALDVTEASEKRTVTGSSKKGYSRRADRSTAPRRSPIDAIRTTHKT